MSQRADLSVDPYHYTKRSAGGWNVVYRETDLWSYLGYVQRGDDGLWRSAATSGTGWRTRREAARQLERLLRGVV